MGVLSKIIYHSYNYKQSGINQPLNLTLNDLVLIKDDNLTRLKWKLGRVIEVYRRDEVSRSAKIKLSQTTLIPPVNKLCILTGGGGYFHREFKHLNLIICFVAVL